MTQFTARQFMGNVTLRGDKWDIEFPVADLDGWIEFYEGMRAKYGHRTQSYETSVWALKAVRGR